MRCDSCGKYLQHCNGGFISIIYKEFLQINEK